MTSDEPLMLDFQRGSREAFEELFARYREPLYGFFCRRLESRERAEDLAQETFLAVIRATSRYEPRALVRTYLYGIALNLLATERRKRLRDAVSAEFCGG
jgi:RNA polymerase sigma-70 factor, ECF subfamily